MRTASGNSTALLPKVDARCGEVDELAERRRKKAGVNQKEEGDLGVAVAARPGLGLVIMAFAESTTWLALDPDQAQRIAGLLLEKAYDVRNGRE